MLSQVSTIAAFAPSQSLETTGLLQSKNNTIVQRTLVKEATEETGSQCTCYSRDEEVKFEKHQESTTLERRTCTEQELEAPLSISSEESQSAISPEKDQAAPQPVTSPAPTDLYTAATYVSHPEAMDIGDNRRTSLNAAAGKDQHHQSVIEHDTTLVFDVAGEDRPNDGNKAASSPTSKKSFPTKPSWSRASQPVILGTNNREPIIIDSDDEGDTQLNVGGDEQYALPSPKRIKRTRAEGPAGLVRWADPKFEKSLLKKASDRFKDIQTIWMQIRDLSHLADESTVKTFDSTVIAIATTDKLVSYGEALLLWNLFEKMDTEILSTATGKDGRLVRKLRKRIRDLPEKTFMTDMVEEYQGKDDDQDSDYRPVKRRRSG